MKFTLLVSALMTLAACTQAPPPVVDTREADAKAIDAAGEESMKGWNSRNAEPIAAIYAPDASVFLPNMPTIKGSEVKQVLTEMLADPNITFQYVNQKTEVAKSGDIGYSQGTYAITMTDAKTKKVMLDKGRYLTVFAKQADGSWKATSDMNTPDGPPTVVEPKK